jgi:hypothetical protein
MSSLNPRIERLKAIIGLEEKRAALQSQLDALTSQIATLSGNIFSESPAVAAKAPAKSSVRVAKPSKGRAQRGALKESILAALSSAGSTGVRVTELASQLGTKAANIHAWFHSTAKSIPGIVKIAGGHYRLDGKSAPAAPAAKPAAKATPTPKAKAAPSKKKGKGSKRGQLSENILKSLEAAGEKGLTIKDLAAKTGAKYRNVAVWFVTTGKNYPKIKKIAPAHFKLAK